ncbi:MAG: phenylacetic acid degradation operon negative regulatory protein PaaX [Gammaproteobacteria bacterium]|nr:phenylacetic acid degradation operon negative regulatory protein PaaX [Gammaproteobacteria bacterium]
MPAAKVSDTKPGSFRQAAARLVEDFRSRRPLRAGSLVISVFGDAIAPRGGAIWLGSLINLLQPFGINQRLVRTSVFRLAKEGWFDSEQIGRRSFYSLTPKGRARFQAASRRIYSEPRHDWQGTWNLVLLSGVDAQHRDAVRKELVWSGFAPFSANVLAHPSADMRAVEERLDGLPGNDQLLIMRAEAMSNRQGYLRRLVHESWALADLSSRYGEFLQRFRPVYQTLRRRRSPDPELAFRVRTLLIHEYRKILLRDPFLPDDLLPERWDGVAAYQLCRNLYNEVALPTEEYLTAEMETADGPLPPAGPDFFRRFGGLITE